MLSVISSWLISWASQPGACRLLLRALTCDGQTIDKALATHTASVRLLRGLGHARRRLERVRLLLGDVSDGRRRVSDGHVGALGDASALRSCAQGEIVNNAATARGDGPRSAANDGERPATGENTQLQPRPLTRASALESLADSTAEGTRSNPATQRRLSRPHMKMDASKDSKTRRGRELEISRRRVINSDRQHSYRTKTPIHITLQHV